MMAKASGSSVSGPKFMVPRHRRLTRQAGPAELGVVHGGTISSSGRSWYGDDGIRPTPVKET